MDQNRRNEKKCSRALRHCKEVSLFSKASLDLDGSILGRTRTNDDNANWAMHLGVMPVGASKEARASMKK